MKPNDKLVSDLQKMHEADLERIKKFRLIPGLLTKRRLAD